MTGSKRLANEQANRMKSVEAAAYMGISANSLEKFRSEGRGPRYMKLGGRVFYRKTDLDAYLESRMVETTDSRRAATA